MHHSFPKVRKSINHQSLPPRLKMQEEEVLGVLVVGSTDHQHPKPLFEIIPIDALIELTKYLMLDRIGRQGDRSAIVSLILFERGEDT
jgi:hypothetical protein